MMLECAVERWDLPGVNEKWNSVKQGGDNIVEVATHTHEVCRGVDVAGAGERGVEAVCLRRCDWHAACPYEYLVHQLGGELVEHGQDCVEVGRIMQAGPTVAVQRASTRGKAR